MKTIICKFKSEGVEIRKTAILNDSLDDFSKSKKNEATDICGPYEYSDHQEWSIYFHVSDALGYEVVFKCDRNRTKTLEPLRAVTWSGEDAGVVTDSQKVSVTIR